ncbi:hypothetical protein ACJB9C_002262 [Listeria monocytogenes]
MSVFWLTVSDALLSKSYFETAETLALYTVSANRLVLVNVLSVVSSGVSAPPK